MFYNANKRALSKFAIRISYLPFYFAIDWIESWNFWVSDALFWVNVDGRKERNMAVHIGQVEIQSYGQVQNIGMYDGAQINFGKWKVTRYRYFLNGHSQYALQKALYFNIDQRLQNCLGFVSIICHYHSSSLSRDILDKQLHIHFLFSRMLYSQMLKVGTNARKEEEWMTLLSVNTL